MKLSIDTKKIPLGFLLVGTILMVGWGVLAIGRATMRHAKRAHGRHSVHVHAASPIQRTGISTALFEPTKPIRKRTVHNASATQTIGGRPMELPTISMNSTTLFIRPVSTATPHNSIGHKPSSGGGFVANTGILSTAEESKRKNSSFGGNMLALASATMLTAPGARGVADMAGTANYSGPSGPNKVGRDDNGGEPGYDTPVGDAWWLMIALGALYGAVVVMRRKRVNG